MTRGTKPTPTHLKLIRGNPGKRKINKREPKPKSGMPPAPSELDARGKKEWARINKSLDGLGLLTSADAAVLALYCAAYSAWCAAQKELKAGHVVKAGNGTPIPSPWLVISNRSADQIVKFGAELGLTPSARSRLQVPDIGGGDESGWDALD